MLENYFGLRSAEGSKPGATFIAMKDDAGFVLTLMEKKEGVAYPNSFHLGFLKQGREKLLEVYERLKMDRCTVDAPRVYRGTILDLYFHTPFGFTLQVSE